MPITNLIRDNWCRFQGELFPEIQDAVGPLLKNHQRLVMALGIICPEDFTLRTSQRNGRPLCDRINLVRAFIAKAICDIPTTRDLVERLKVDRQMRNLCGWVLIHEIPSDHALRKQQIAKHRAAHKNRNVANDFQIVTTQVVKHGYVRCPKFWKNYVFALLTGIYQ